MTGEAATLPPAGLPGLDPAWSRLVEVTDERDGARLTWHVLDNGVEPATGTLLCVHGNPTWSYLWRHVLTAAPPGWRVVAVDQLGMGYSQRLEAPRSLAERITDLGDLTFALGVDGPVVTIAHDWGGPVSLGWALSHREQLRGIVLANTAVHHGDGAGAPALIRLAASAPLRRTICVRTPAFVAGATALSRPSLPDAVRRAFAAPYRTAARRRSVGDFVADIPLVPTHPSAATLREIGDGLSELTDVPALLLWGARDPVFSDRYLRDLLGRLPQAQLQRYGTASHLVTEDAPQSADTVARWLSDLDRPPVGEPLVRAPNRPLWAALHDRADDRAPAVVDLAGRRRTVSFMLLEKRTREVAAGLAASGVRPGHRVALLIPPSADLTAAAYAVWRAGASIVVADRGLGIQGIGQALSSARPDHVIGSAAGLAAAQAMRLPGTRITAGSVAPPLRRVLRAELGMADLARLGRGALEQPDRDAQPDPDADAECAVVFTSGATGPAKGVVYRHRQVRAQLDLLVAAYGLTGEDRLVAAFAPFALYGPALGITSAVPDMDVSAPGTLTAAALAHAVSAVDATVVFASPAALRNVLATEHALDGGGRRALEGVRLLMSAGAPVPAALVRGVGALVPRARVCTPYGMTEALPVTDGLVDESTRAMGGNGVCVGRALHGVDVAVSPLAPDGAATAPLVRAADVTGEVAVRAAHVKDRYDALWAVERESSRDAGWHRTGDVGHIADDGRLWIEGRLVHVVTTSTGPVTPVGVEQRVEALDDVRAAAAVGVGPPGAQEVVVVVELEDPGRRRRSSLATTELTDAVRRAAGVRVAAVLVTARLPVDVRHASKVDRVAVASSAARLLAGSRP